MFWRRSKVDVRPSEGDNVQGRETAEMRQLPETEIRNILKPRESKPKQVNGYFVEIGAGDGESESITLMMERERQWSGLLIEQDPTTYEKLVEKRRKAVLLNACVKTNVTENWIEYATSSKPHRVPCFWIDSILRANAISTIEVLTINVSGKEENILRSFPFDKIHVTILTAVLNGKVAISASISSLMSERGFRTVKLMSNHIVDKTYLIFLNQLKTKQSLNKW